MERLTRNTDDLIAVAKKGINMHNVKEEEEIKEIINKFADYENLEELEYQFFLA